jgi:HK97 family phage major capsid protein
MLKQLMLNKKIEQARNSLNELIEKAIGFDTRKKELEIAIRDAETDEEIAVVEENIVKLEAEETEVDEKKSELEGEIKTLEKELEELKSNEPKNNIHEERSKNVMERGDKSMSIRDRTFDLIKREEVKDFLIRAREFMSQKRSITGSELLIPDIMLGLLRDTISEKSKLINKVNYKPLKGTARQNVTGTIPEAVWTEMVGALNELEISFNQVEVDGFKVGGFVVIPNTTLKDNDFNLFTEIVSQLSKAIAIALDKAILYGKGVKQPLGIVTRLQQESKPSGYPEIAPKWKDLHETNIKKVNTTGIALVGSIVEAFGACKSNFSDGNKFFAMNNITYTYLLTTLLNFNAAGAIATGMGDKMPIIGGDIVILDFMSNYDIVGGYGDLYLLAEREGTVLAASEHVQFIEDNTVVKGLARYDGLPVIAEGFFTINIKNTEPAKTKDFKFDYANTELEELGVKSDASETEDQKTKITITGAKESGTSLAYKLGGSIANVSKGDKKTGFTTWDGVAEIESLTGAIITVVEFDSKNKAIKAGAAIVTVK